MSAETPGRGARAAGGQWAPRRCGERPRPQTGSARSGLSSPSCPGDSRFVPLVCEVTWGTGWGPPGLCRHISQLFNGLVHRKHCLSRGVPKGRTPAHFPAPIPRSPLAPPPPPARESARATSCLPWGRAGWAGRDTVLGVNIPWSFRRFLGSGGAQRSAGRPAPLLQAEAPRAGPGRWHRGPRPARRPGVGTLTKARLEERNPRRGFAAAGELRGVPSMWFLRPNCLLPASPAPAAPRDQERQVV